ncbi:MAG: aminoacyl-tRNA hydrolase [Erysipelotrichaceae bacterium]|nr:aminoacyl-tRNA hydrolase [Erysipelotrichaceae bacterium]
MKLIVGLGNPGSKYEGTRHNTGFMAIDAFAESVNQKIDIQKFKGQYVKFKYKGEDIILLKPMTYMNNSGESVIACMNYFKIDVKDLLVIYDDLDMPTGKLRLREKGSAGGHNGVKSIIHYVGSQEFKRIRIGIDHIPRWDTINFVLGRFLSDEQPLIEEGIKNAVAAIHCYLDDNFSKAMNNYN